jgi:hypothetical protein
MEILSLKAKPINRHQKRLMKKEVEWVFKQLEKTLDWMMQDLFNEDSSQYEETYKYYLKQYIEVLEWMGKHKKLTYVKLNPYFFEQFFGAY